MNKAFSVIKDLNKDAIDILKNNNIQLTINDSGYIPNTEELIALLQEYDVLIIGVKTIVTKDILEYINSPKIIATSSIGLDHIDKEVRESGLIHVINIKNANTISVAEHIFSLILGLNKRVYESNNLVLQQKGHKKNSHERPEDISNKKLGLIGAGNITKEVIKIAKIFNIQMSCYTRNPNNHKDLLEYGVVFKSLDEILKESDIINVSIPLTDETKYLIAKDKIELMKPTATFINTSRVDIVDTKSLIEKADKYNTFYVGLDIDLDEHKDLLSQYRDNVIITPHTAGVSKQAIERMEFELANNIVNCLNGGIRK
ncbi:MAG: NAD(P)-dependent oxidoreductase [Bacilli bacterium]|nr:NAD(P)-dependent oxidoreductase [Bacilli bacterium]